MRQTTIRLVERHLARLAKENRSFAISDVYEKLRDKYTHLEFDEIRRIVLRSFKHGIMHEANYCATNVPVIAANGQTIEKTIYFSQKSKDIDKYTSEISSKPKGQYKAKANDRPKNGILCRKSGKLVLSAKLMDQLSLNGQETISIAAQYGEIKVNCSACDANFQYRRVPDGRLVIGKPAAILAFGDHQRSEDFTTHKVSDHSLIVTLSKE